MLSRMEDPATVALLFVDRDSEDQHNRGDDPILGAAGLNAETGRVSTSPVQAAAREVGFMC